MHARILCVGLFNEEENDVAATDNQRTEKNQELKEKIEVGIVKMEGFYGTRILGQGSTKTVNFHSL
jgi:hypothetical protein